MIKLPRNYLSWSALSCWEKSPEDFKRHYFFGEQIVFPNMYMDFGKKLADALETGKPSGDKGIEHAKMFIPNYHFKENAVIAESPTCRLLAKMDGFDKKPPVIHEVKSGKLWTQKRVDELGQITHYSYTYWLSNKRKMAKLLLHWVETKVVVDAEGREYVVATGKVVTFETFRTIQDFIKYEIRIKNCYNGIVEMAKELNKSIG